MNGALHHNVHILDASNNFCEQVFRVTWLITISSWFTCICVATGTYQFLWLQSRYNIVSQSVKISVNRPGTKTYVKEHRELCLQLQPRVQKEILTEEGMWGQECKQEHSSGFLGNCSPISVPKCQTVGAEYYCDALKRLKENTQQYQSELWHAGDWTLIITVVHSIGNMFLVHNNSAALSPPTSHQIWLPANSVCSPKCSVVSRT